MTAGKWLTVFIEQNDGSDFNDGEDVLGYINPTLEGDVLTITYTPDSEIKLHPPATERYRLVPIESTEEV